MKKLYRIVATGKRMVTWSVPNTEEECLYLLGGFQRAYGINEFALVPCNNDHKDGIKVGEFQENVPVIVTDYSLTRKVHTCKFCQC